MAHNNSPARIGARTASERRALALKAATHAYLYAGAVKHEAQQLLLADAAENSLPADAADLVSAARQSKALMLIVALRNVLRAAEMACHYAERPEKQNLKAALGRFKNAFPGLTEARNTIEHFDDYEDVDGKPAVLYEVTFTRGNGTYVISVGDIHIDVEVALREARHLAGNVIAVGGDSWHYPVGNELRSQ
jgi:hypothetical protein